MKTTRCNIPWVLVWIGWQMFAKQGNITKTSDLSMYHMYVYVNCKWFQPLETIFCRDYHETVPNNYQLRFVFKNKDRKINFLLFVYAIKRCEITLHISKACVFENSPDWCNIFTRLLSSHFRFRSLVIFQVQTLICMFYFIVRIYLWFCLSASVGPGFQS